MFKKITVTITMLITAIFLVTSLEVYAQPANTNQTGQGSCEGDPYKIPAQCEDNFVIDQECQTIKILSPQSEQARTCCLHKCKDEQTSVTGNTDNILDQKDLSFLNVFGVRLGLDFSESGRTKTITTLINLVITTILGIFSMYALFRGVYLVAIQRPVLIKPEDISKLNKQFTSLIVGFVLAWGIIFIIQVVFAFLGLGSLTDFNFENAANGITITIK